jgi:hypothetical protein
MRVHASRNCKQPEDVIGLTCSGVLAKNSRLSTDSKGAARRPRSSVVWLTEAFDRVGSDELKLTHEFLAIMLGVRRPTITIVVGELQKAGLIVNGNRGAIKIPDPKGLEAASCECYAAVKTNFARLLPEIPVPPG